jgi:formate dehydrogenase
MWVSPFNFSIDGFYSLKIHASNWALPNLQNAILTQQLQGGEHAVQEPQLLGTTENELGIRKWIEEQGHTLVTTSDKDGENSKFDQELVDAEVIITTP